jgi:hypothetical protein
MTQNEASKISEGSYSEALTAAQSNYYEAREEYNVIYGTYKEASERFKKAIDIYRAELNRINAGTINS